MNVSPMRRKGFTLIELLIVITIIGILAVALVPKITQGPARARDVQRKADMQNIASALELYYSDTGTYPTVATGCTELDDELLSYLGGTFPEAPAGAAEGTCGSTPGYYYEATGSGAGYIIAAAMETDADSYYCDVDLTGTPPCGTTPPYYVLER